MARKLFLPVLAVMALLIVACGQTPTAQVPPGTASVSGGQALNVMASTTIVADVVRQVGGDKVAVSILVPLGVDAHSFAPTPQDIARVAEARVLFVNGAGYEEFLAPLLENAGGSAELVELSKGVSLRDLTTAEQQAAEEEAGHTGEAHSTNDPHTWTNPENVKYWTKAIAETLGRLDTANADFYRSNAENYDKQLDELDSWIAAQFAELPADRRLLVTDHAVFGYLADRYGLTQVGTIIPGGSSTAAPSAQELAALQEQIRGLGVKAIFVGSVTNQDLARRLAEDTGTRLAVVLTESLTPADGSGATYLDYMRYNVRTMVDALR